MPANNLTILFLGDIYGSVGRKTIKNLLPRLIKKLKPDLVIANAENSAHGSGVTNATIAELQSYGIDYFTAGDHAFDRLEQAKTVYSELPIVRPANFPPMLPGKEFAIIPTKKGDVLLFALLGRVFMPMQYDCPFRKADQILANNDFANKNFSAILVDIHAETTAEKSCLKHYLDGRVSAVLGTHTHIMTADALISKKGTGSITDVGMVGITDHSIGLDISGATKTLITQIKQVRRVPESGKSQLNGVFLTVNTKTAKTVAIEPIIEYTNIK
ncbi:MAG: TIGR00282 family metallophosphoesterase [Candidatus Falkowbacteria bacterium]